MLALISLIENLGLKQVRAIFFSFILNMLKQTIRPIMCFTPLPNYFELHFNFGLIERTIQFTSTVVQMAIKMKVIVSGVLGLCALFSLQNI